MGSFDLRQEVCSMLELLASADAQLQYEQDVPIANVYAELQCMWFDDHYHPTSEQFRASFSEEELVALAEFSNLFRRVSDADHWGEYPQIADMVCDSGWQQLLTAAQVCLTKVCKRSVPAQGHT